MLTSIMWLFLHRACLLLLPVLFLTCEMATAQTRSRAQRVQRATQSPQQILTLGLYYYNNDDITGNAERTLRQLLAPQYKGTNEAETAQYYLGCYFQRKFYLQRARFRSDDWASLKQAVVEFRTYTDKYYSNGRSTWLSDAFFNLAIVYLQLGEPWNATNELSKIRAASARDGTIYIYQVVWSSQSQDVIDSNLSAVRLADYAMSVVKVSPNYFEQAVSMIRKWCQGQKTKGT